jgi:hypothetical protein
MFAIPTVLFGASSGKRCLPALTSLSWRALLLRLPYEQWAVDKDGIA